MYRCNPIDQMVSVDRTADQVQITQIHEVAMVAWDSLLSQLLTYPSSGGASVRCGRPLAPTLLFFKAIVYSLQTTHLRLQSNFVSNLKCLSDASCIQCVQAHIKMCCISLPSSKDIDQC